MRIASPLSNLAEIEPLVKAGTDELYCGVLFGKKTISARPATPQFNFKNLEELKEAIKICHYFNKEIWLTLNYSTQSIFKQNIRDSNLHLKTISELFKRAVELGIDGIMIADIALLLKILPYKSDVKIAISTMLPILNSEAINFFKQFKINRIILERQMSIKEIRSIDKNISNIELEIFVSGRCTYINAFCKLSERLELPHFVTAEPYKKIPAKYLCGLPLRINIVESTIYQKKLSKQIISSVEEKTFKSPKKCSLCSLFYLNKLKNSIVLKLIDRGFPLERKIKTLLPIRDAVDFLSKERPNYQGYSNFCKKILFRKLGFPTLDCNSKFCNYK